METRPKLRMSDQRFGELDCTVLGALPERPPRFCVILCHGFGAPANDLVALGPDLATLCSEAAEVLFVFPGGPLDLGPAGMPGGRAWWMIDIERFQRASQQPEKLARFLHEVPHGLPEASRLLQGLLADVERQLGIPAGRVVLGGFSQGAMLATDVALRLAQPPAGLCVFSGSLTAQVEWEPLARKRGALRVLQSHGYFDPILPFAGAEALRRMLTEAGLEVDFLPFDGPHTIPFEALERLAVLLRKVVTERSAS